MVKLEITQYHNNYFVHTEVKLMRFKAIFKEGTTILLYLFRPVSFPVKATGNVSKSTMSVKQAETFKLLSFENFLLLYYWVHLIQITCMSINGFAFATNEERAHRLFLGLQYIVGHWTFFQLSF